MRKILLASAVLMLFSCGGADSPECDVPELVRAVPSDAMFLAGVSEVHDVMVYCDSSSVLHSLSFEGVEDSPAVFALCFNTSVVPLLIMDAGDVGEPDASAFVSSLMEQADSLGIRSMLSATGDIAGKSRRILALCPSENILASVSRHLSEGACLMDAPGFLEAFATAGRPSEALYMRSEASSRVIPREFLAGLCTHAGLSSFVKKFSEWDVFVPDSGKNFEVFATTSGYDAYYMQMLESLPDSRSFLGKSLPQAAVFALDLPISSTREFRKSYERFRDAGVTIDAYRDTLSHLEDKSGKSPLAWERDLSVREVALVRCDSVEVLLVRPSDKPAESAVGENPYRGFVKALYGSAFDIPDPCVGVSGNWLVYGTGEDISAFMNMSPMEKNGFATKCRASVWTPDWSAVVSEDGVELEIKNDRWR